MAGTSPDEAWVFYVSDVHRMNSGPMQQLEHFRTRSAVTVEWLYQLYMALEADVWIGTRNSNWNRLIDEMRCGPVMYQACVHRVRAAVSACSMRRPPCVMMSGGTVRARPLMRASKTGV